MTRPGEQPPPPWPGRPEMEAARACVLRVPCTSTQPGGSGRALLPPDHSLQVPIYSEVTDDSSGQSPEMTLSSSPHGCRKRSGGLTSRLIQASSSLSVFEHSLASKPLRGLHQIRASSRFLKCPLAFLLWACSHKPLYHKTTCGHSNHSYYLLSGFSVSDRPRAGGLMSSLAPLYRKTQA